MKKICFVIVFEGMALLTAGATDFFSLSAGIGMEFSFLRRTLEYTENLSYLGEKADNVLRFGAIGFLDATFVQVDFGYPMGNVYDGFGLGIKGKYPFVLTKNIVLFPLAGFELLFGDPGMVFLTTGIGMDFFMNGKYFFRGEILYENMITKKVNNVNNAALGTMIKIYAGYKF